MINTRLKRQALIFVVTLLGFSVPGTAWLAYDAWRQARDARNQTDSRICYEVEKIKKNIRASIVKSDHELQSGKYKSFQLSVEDLRRAHRQSQRELYRFRPLNCADLPPLKAKQVNP